MILKDVAIVKGGKRLPKTDELVSYRTEHPYIRIRDMYQSYPLELNSHFEYITDETHKKIKKYVVNQGDVIIAVVGTIGLVSLIGESLDGANLTENCNKLVDLNNYDNKFLYYFLTSKQGQDEIQKGIVGSSQPKLPIYNVEKFEIPDVLIDTQIKIVSVLESIDKKIKINELINRNLEAQAFALFDSYFPRVMYGDSRIGDYITPKRGKNLLSKDAIPGDVPVVAGGLSPSTYHNESNTVGPVLTISASGANAGYVGLWNQSVWSSDSSYIDSRMTNDVYFWYVMLKKRQKEVFDSQTGSAQPHIYPKHIEVMPVIELDKATIEDYTKEVTPMFNMIGTNNKESVRMVELRDSLLPKLMSGELDVSDLEI